MTQRIRAGLLARQGPAYRRRAVWLCQDSRFEFEMLCGVRPDLQRALAQRGYRVRAWLPFGTDWFPYAIRRIGEPCNLRFAVSAVTR